MNFIDFAKTIGNLKNIKRAGWVKAGIENPESVADHVMRLSVLALVAGRELGVNPEKLANMALIHDLAESLIGDVITAPGGIEDPSIRREKYKVEKSAIRKLFKKMKDGEKFTALWEEFEKQETPEAKVLRQLDKFEMVLQALEYEYEDKASPKDLDAFWVHARKVITHPVVKKWLVHIVKQRGKTQK